MFPDNEQDELQERMRLLRSHQGVSGDRAACSQQRSELYHKEGDIDSLD